MKFDNENDASDKINLVIDSRMTNEDFGEFESFPIKNLSLRLKQNHPEIVVHHLSRHQMIA
jgi:hypothetical protein